MAAARAGAGCSGREGPPGLGCSCSGGITGRGRWPPRWKGTRAAPVLGGGVDEAGECGMLAVGGPAGRGRGPWGGAACPSRAGGAEGEVSAAPCQLGFDRGGRRHVSCF